MHAVIGELHMQRPVSLCRRPHTLMACITYTLTATDMCSAEFTAHRECSTGLQFVCVQVSSNGQFCVTCSVCAHIPHTCSIWWQSVLHRCLRMREYGLDLTFVLNVDALVGLLPKRVADTRHDKRHIDRQKTQACFVLTEQVSQTCWYVRTLA